RTGSYANDALQIYVGWATREGSFADCLPIWNQSHDACLLFVGENFMEPAEIRRLCGTIDETRSSRAGHLMALYEALGLRFLEHLNGWFAGIAIDLRDRTAVLFNDRFGLGRIYYHEQAGRFHFASEAKSLLEALPHLRTLDMRG